MTMATAEFVGEMVAGHRTAVRPRTTRGSIQKRDTETIPTRADRRPRTKVQSPLTTQAETVHGTAPPEASPRTTPSLAGPHEETLEIKN